MTDLLARLQAALGDRYTVERELAAGGMGRVFVALERGLERRVAVKVLPPDLAAAVSVERFRREIQLAASLQHPHIVPLLAAGEAGGLLYYTMPFIDGETLRARLARDGRLRVPDAVRILRHVLDALAYAHRRGVVHRDIKPENILLVDDHALVTDFGVAKALTQATGGSGLTTAGVALGTPAYMAPEQAAGDPAVDHRSDVYAAGVVAYEMLGGETPFGGAAQRVLAAQVMERPRSVARIRPDLAPALVSGVMRCLEKDPADRWQSADDLKRELDSAATVGPASVGGSRRRWRTAVVVLLVAASLVAGWAAWRAGAHPGGVASPALVAVLPFAVRGSADVAYLGEGIVSLLSTSLDGAGDLRSVDPRAVLSVVQRRGGGLLDPAGAAAVAARLGAGLYVLGDVVEAGGRVQITASLFDREHAASPLARGTVEGSSGQVFSLVDGLATHLLAGTSSGPKGRVTRVASVTTPSLAAYKAFLDGDAAFRAGRADSAVVAFERAVGLDTAFALAYYRLSVAAEWATLSGSFIARTAEQAVRHSARLTDHDRSLLRALLATRRGAAVEAEALYRSILGAYPDDIEAWSQLGEVLFHYGPEQGRSIVESRAPFERVLYFDPGYVSALVHLARIAAMERRGATVDSIVGLIEKLSPASDRDLEMRVLRAYSLGDAKAQQRVLTELGRASDATLTLPVWDVAVFTGDLDGAEAIARILADPGRSVEAQATGHVSLAYLALGRGKLAAARAELRRAAVADPVRAIEYGTLLELTPFLQAPRAVLEAAQRDLDRLAAGAIPPSAQSTVYFSVHDGIHRLLRAYLLGLLSAQLGDFASAERQAATVSGETGPSGAAGLPRDLGLEIRAEAAIKQGAPAAALGLLKQRSGESWYEYHFASPFLANSRERYRRAGLEADQGEASRAIALFGGFEGFSGYALIYAAPSHLRRAALYERLGDRTAAAAHYTRFLTLWKDCDPEFRPLVEGARRRMAN